MKMDRKKTRSEVGWGVEWQKRREKSEQKQREELKDEGFKESLHPVGGGGDLRQHMKVRVKCRND